MDHDYISVHHCKLTYSTSKFLRDHEYSNLHSKCSNDAVEPHTCHCIFRSFHKWKVTKHIKGIHQNSTDFQMVENVKYKCTTCAFQTFSFLCLYRHLLLTKCCSAVSTHDCDDCLDVEMSQAIIKKKQYDFLDKMDLFKCDDCIFNTSRRYDLRRHMTRVHNKWFSPNSTRLTISRIIKKHLRLRCRYCDYKTNFKKDLKHHFIMKHIPNSAKGFEFESPESKLKHHPEFKEKSINWFRCRDCPYQSRHLPNLRRHIKRHDLCLKSSQLYRIMLSNIL